MISFNLTKSILFLGITWLINRWPGKGKGANVLTLFKVLFMCDFLTCKSESLCVLCYNTISYNTLFSWRPKADSSQLALLTPRNKKRNKTRMWANAQPDGRPAKQRWRPLFNAAKFGWRPLLDAVRWCRAEMAIFCVLYLQRAACSAFQTWTKTKTLLCVYCL